MEIQIETVEMFFPISDDHFESMDKAYPILKEYGYRIELGENRNRDKAFITVNTIEDLMRLSKEIGYSIIVDSNHDRLLIYDDWME